MKRNIKIALKKDIFNKSNLDIIDKEIRKYNTNEYYEYEYDLIIKIKNSDITNQRFEQINFSYWRLWHKDYNFRDNLKLSLRILISQITECLENNYLYIRKILVKNDDKIEHTEIELGKIGVHNYNNKQQCTKFHLNINILNEININEILDLIKYEEYEFYIDERNNNKKNYNLLLLKKESGLKLDINSLTEQDWKQLILKEKVTNKELADLYELKEMQVTKIRKKFISNIKSYNDEYIFYYTMFNSISFSDYYSNFCIPLLEQMKSKKIDYIYEYLNLNYNELFFIEDELKNQKEIERNNLSGKKYVMPLSGVILKKFYEAVKLNQLDRKFFKSNWFNIYYDTTFLKIFLEEIEKSHILDLYETGEIYNHSSFEPYQELYKKWNIIESNKLSDNVLTKIAIKESRNHIKKKSLKRVIPKNYIDLAKIKSDIGRIGEELVYNYEVEALKDYPELQKKIEKTYLKNDNAGYDIKSYDYKGNELFIELKTNKTSSNTRIKFYISNNEDEFICTHKNAYIYYIYDLNNPKLQVIDQKTYLSYYKKPINYEIDQEIISN